MSLGTIHEIPLGDIAISSNNVRLHDPERDLDELAASIKQHGLLQPVVLLGEEGKPGKPPYQLISGQRRFLAHKQLHAKTIRAIFAGKLDKTQAIVRSLVENLQRVELEYVDTAKAITELFYKFGNDEEKVQKETGLSLRKIREYIQIEAQATPKMKQLLEAKKVSASDVKRALRAAQDNIKKAEELLELIVKFQPTAHQKRRLVQYGEQDKKATAKHIVEEALKPHIEENIVISLPEAVRKGLLQATKKMSMEPEELASKILNDWLDSQGFLK
jgi:ParB family chromosome partitioning protein